MRIAICGAGPAGSLLAGLLAKDGHTVFVYEKRGDSRNASIHQRTFIGLLLTLRGEHQVAQVGLSLDEIKTYTSHLDGRFIHNSDGTRTLVQWGSSAGSSCRSIDRTRFINSLVNKAEALGAVFSFNNPVTDINVQDGIVHTEGGEAPADPFDLIVGCDGVNSVVRNYGFKHTIDMTETAYCWLIINKGTHDTSKINVWPHTFGIAHGTPSYHREDKINITFIIKVELMKEFQGNPAKVKSYLQTHAKRLLECDDTIPEQIASADYGLFRTIVSDMVSKEGNLALLGDSAHAMSPYLGQGMNISLEDATELARSLRQHPTDIQAALRLFSSQRTPEYKACHSLVDLQRRYFTNYIRAPLTTLRMKYHAVMRQVAPFAYPPTLREMVNNPEFTFVEAEELLNWQNQFWCFGRIYE